MIKLDAKALKTVQGQEVALLLSFPTTIFEIVRSSNLVSVSYHPGRRTMDVEFGSSTYRYYNVPRRTFNDLLKAKSKGKFFWRRIRQKPFKYAKIR